MAKNSQVVRMVTVLGIVAALSGLFLATFYGWINPIVESRKEQEVIDLGLRAIFPDVDTFAAIHLDEPPTGVESPIYEVWDEAGDRLGYFMNATGEGWGTLQLAVGFNPDTMQVSGVRVLAHEETPGLGSRIEEESWLAQFAGKSLSDPFEAGQDVDMITGATVSTQGVAQTVARSARLTAEELGFGTVAVQEVATTAPGPAQGGAVTGMPLPTHADTILQLAGEQAESLGTANIWEVRDEEDQVISVAVLTSEAGFGGNIDVLTLIDPQTTNITAITVLSHNETPGIGDPITGPAFLNQFVGKNAGDALTVSEDIDSVMMATVSSKAVTNAARRAAHAVSILYGTGLGGGS